MAKHKTRSTTVTAEGLRLEQDNTSPQFSSVFKGLASTFYLNDARKQHQKHVELLSQAQAILAQKQLDDETIEFGDILCGETEIVLTDSLSPATKEKITTKKQIRRAAKDKVAAFEKRIEQKSKRAKKVKEVSAESTDATLSTTSNGKQSSRKVRSQALFDVALKKLTSETPMQGNKKQTKSDDTKAQTKVRPPIVFSEQKDNKSSLKLDENQPEIHNNQPKFNKSEFSSNEPVLTEHNGSRRAVKKLKEVYGNKANQQKRTGNVGNAAESVKSEVIDEQLVQLESGSSAWSKIYAGAVLKLRERDFLALGLPKEIAEHRKVVAFEINQENRYIVTKIFNSYYTLPFSCFEFLVSRPIRYAEKELGLSTLSGYHKINFKNRHIVDNDLSRYYIRWFGGSVLVADFVGTMPNLEFSVVVKDEVLYRDRFARFVGRLAHFIERCGIRLSDYSLEPITDNKGKLAVIFALIADYIIGKEYYYCSLEMYLRKTVIEI